MQDNINSNLFFPSQTLISYNFFTKLIGNLFHICNDKNIFSNTVSWQTISTLSVELH